jgi:hypothetical protein
MRRATMAPGGEENISGFLNGCKRACGFTVASPRAAHDRSLPAIEWSR